MEGLAIVTLVNSVIIPICLFLIMMGHGSDPRHQRF